MDVIKLSVVAVALLVGIELKCGATPEDSTAGHSRNATATAGPDGPTSIRIPGPGADQTSRDLQIEIIPRDSSDSIPQEGSVINPETSPIRHAVSPTKSGPLVSIEPASDPATTRIQSAAISDAAIPHAPSGNSPLSPTGVAATPPVDYPGPTVFAPASSPATACPPPERGTAEPAPRQLKLQLRELALLRKAAQEAGGDLEVSIRTIRVRAEDLVVPLLREDCFTVQADEHSPFVWIQSKDPQRGIGDLQSEIARLELRRRRLLQDLAWLQSAPAASRDNRAADRSEFGTASPASGGTERPADGLPDRRLTVAAPAVSNP